MAYMGCADGGTSIDMIGGALRYVRERAPSRPLTMTYTDLPRNDFSQVFQIVHGQTDIPAYAADIDNLFVFASGTSFHQRIFPVNSLNFGFSATASHYISERPDPITSHVHMIGAEGAELTAYAEQGRADWERILSCRAAGLVSGGRLVLLNFCRDEEGRYLGGTEGVNMFHTFDRLWREMADDGTITMAEYEATVFPQYYRDVTECSAPLVGQPRLPGRPAARPYRNPRHRLSLPPRLRAAWRPGEVRQGIHPDFAVLERKRVLRRPVERPVARRARRNHRPLLRFLRNLRTRKAGRSRHGLRPHLHGHA